MSTDYTNQDGTRNCLQCSTKRLFLQLGDSGMVKASRSISGTFAFGKCDGAVCNKLKTHN